MPMSRTVTRSTVTLGALALALGLGGCAAKVTRTDFNNEVAKIREEMQTGDKALSDRIDEQGRRLDAVEKDLQAFRSEYNVSMERMKGMLRFNVPVHFEFGSAELREADRPVLDRFAGVVKEHYPNAVITVEGFTDPRGTVRYNQRLGMQRATAVKSYLASNAGMDAANLRTVSYGEVRNRQVVPGAGGPEQGMENRRVTLVIENADSVAGTPQAPAAAQ